MDNFMQKVGRKIYEYKNYSERDIGNKWRAVLSKTIFYPGQVSMMKPRTSCISSLSLGSGMENH